MLTPGAWPCRRGTLLRYGELFLGLVGRRDELLLRRRDGLAFTRQLFPFVHSFGCEPYRLKFATRHQARALVV